MADPIEERIRQAHYEDEREEAFVTVLVTAARLRRALDEVCGAHDLTDDQYNVLRILQSAHPEGYPRYEIIERLIERSPDVTRLLDRLERRGLIERYRSDEDRRLSLARISDDGLALLRELAEPVRRLHARSTATLSPDECETLSRLCASLLQAG